MSQMSVDHNEKPRLVVTLCTYNERENIAKLVPQVLSALPFAHVLVVDDSSPDGTADVVRQLMSADSRVKLLLRTAKEGLGAATIAGFQWAIDHEYELAVEVIVHSLFCNQECVMRLAHSQMHLHEHPWREQIFTRARNPLIGNRTPNPQGPRTRIERIVTEVDAGGD